MTVDLRSVLAKLGRADEHAQTIKSHLKRWRDSNPYLITREHNAEFTRYSLVAHIAAQPPLVQWSLIVGDAIHNLRSALDHLVYALAIFESHQNPPPCHSSLQFTICVSDDEFIKTKRLGRLSDPVRAAIKGFQPYIRKHPDLPPLLSILNKFENADKHKLLQLAFASVAQGDIGFTGVAPIGTVVEAFANPGEVEEGTEVVAYTFSKPAPDMKFDRINLLIALMIVHDVGPNGKDRTDAPSLLTLLDKEVRGIVEKVANVALS
jgi:hypothetical protein